MKIYLIHEKENPTTNFFLMPLLEYKKLSFEVISCSDFNHQAIDLTNEVIVIIVRYLNNYIIDFLKKNFKKIYRIFYFMDDDLWDIRVLAYLPFKYALKIHKSALKYKKDLLRLGITLLVSNEYLANKYSKYKPEIIYPYPSAIDTKYEFIDNSNNIVAYHATSSYKSEFSWIANLVGSLPEYLFEIVVDKANFKYFVRLNNCWLLYPMSWPIYKNFIKTQKRPYFIALQLDNPFNRARSYVKFYNIIQMGAIGFYSDTFPEANLIDKFQAGIVLKPEISLWIKTFKNSISCEEKKLIFNNSLKLLTFFKERALRSYEKCNLL
ncbi:MAG: hypothetical protein RMJ67_05270 [Elusimicrobiota bacterium]|nr:hypothetical protein [Endomicrobiia bacterium]MDW7998803.1 hypothetical protein [Thermodesulfovibrio sp.]MDW8165900.1 hypothetical protein [Elusimicrobiota bacterium]